MRYPIPALILISLLQGSPPTVAADSAPLRIATFSVDITPPPGQPVGLGFIPVLKTVEHPLLARGILLQDAGVSCVICTLDWMEVHNESYDLLRHTIATAAGVPESHVALHCLHQHTAPAISTAAQRLQLQQTALRRIASTDYLVNVSGKLSRAIQACRMDWRPVTRVGTGQARVDRVASSRRIERADGSIQGRSSSTAASPELRTLKEGLIDPWVRTVTLENDSGPVAQLHYYASHPQSFYGDSRASYDVPGIVRDRLERDTGVFQLYLTGCGGDVAFGKYNDGSKQARRQLAERLLTGIRQSLASVKQHPVEPLRWSVSPVHFPLRTDPAFSEETSRRILKDSAASESQRRKAAITLAWIERVQSGQSVELSCLSIGDVRMLHLPGEPFVQFQIAAQNMRPDQFICVAGYGDCGMGYLGGDRIFTDRGGYEQTYSFAGPSEKLLLSAIQTLLKSPGPDTSSRNNRLPRYVVHRADSDIRVDGRLDEPAWKNASVFENFRFAWWQQGQREQTVARMVWDDQFLYVSYECEDAHISAAHTERDSPVYEDDCVELFTAPSPSQPNNYFNIEMNVNRAILDQHHPRGPGRSQTQNWNAVGIQIATTVDGTLNQDTDTDRGWVLEVAIPFSNFAEVTGTSRPREGDIWHLNLNRLGGNTNPQYSQWSPGKTSQPAFHTPDTFGRVTFSTRTSTEQSLHDLAVAGYEPVPGFLKLPDHITLGDCSAVDIDSTGTLYLFHRGRQPILCFSHTGTFIRSWGDTLIGKAHGLRVDPDDNVWVTDTGHHTVFKFSPDGKLLLALGTPDRPGTGRDQFDRPTDVAFGTSGDVFVADGYGNSRIVKFDRTGRFQSTWGTAGTQPGQFNLPHSLFVDRKGRLLVGDRENDRIQIFDPDGRHLETWNGFAPYGIAGDRTHQVFIADGRANQILRLNATGGVALRIGSRGHSAGRFVLPHMLAIDQEGSLYVAEVGGRRFQKFRKQKPERDR